MQWGHAVTAGNSYCFCPDSGTYGTASTVGGNDGTWYLGTDDWGADHADQHHLREPRIVTFPLTQLTSTTWSRRPITT